MKDLNTYKAEIFSRSEKRIKKRRRVQRALVSLGVLLFVAATVLTVVMLQERTILETTDTLFGVNTPPTAGSADTYDQNDRNESKSTVISVTSSEGTAFSITAAERSENIKSTLSELFTYNIPPAASGSGAALKDQLADDAENEHTESEHVCVQYTVVVISADGTKKKYVLRGTELSDADSGDTVIITEENAERLLSLLTNAK